jgi:hypothetical protein
MLQYHCLLQSFRRLQPVCRRRLFRRLQLFRLHQTARSEFSAVSNHSATNILLTVSELPAVSKLTAASEFSATSNLSAANILLADSRFSTASKLPAASVTTTKVFAIPSAISKLFVNFVITADFTSKISTAA